MNESVTISNTFPGFLEVPKHGPTCTIHDAKLKEQKPAKKQGNEAQRNTALIKTQVWYMALY
jgi:hypothetical protein